MISAIWTGCSIRTKSFYLLEGAQQIEKHAVLRGSVGIENIILPRYFRQGNIALKEDAHKVSFLSGAHWVSDMNEQLTSALISYLKHYFKSTDIYLYPWDVSQNVTRKVSIRVENFIYHDKQVHLDASWEIKSKDGIKVAKFFHLSLPSSSDTDSIVKQMDVAFSKLEAAIAKSLS